MTTATKTNRNAFVLSRTNEAGVVVYLADEAGTTEILEETTNFALSKTFAGRAAFATWNAMIPRSYLEETWARNYDKTRIAGL